MSSVIAGRYELERRLGIGGMSTVQLAFDRRLERHVAVKLLAEHLADDPSFVSRFRREALAAARLVHPNVVQVFDFGLDEAQHQHFIVMEYVQGQSCAQLLRDRGHLDVDEAVEILTQACRGLDYAHRNGVVHRDVKPGNLLRSQDGVVKLADFGIAKATEQSSITQIGSVLGTAAYLAPEQARGEEAGPRADIYSLGVVAYQLLSGRLPYEATSLSELALKQQREAPLRLEDLNPSVPQTLSQAVSIALALEPEGRYHDAEAFGRALRDGARGASPFAETDPTSHLPQGTAATRVLRGSAAAAAGAAAGAAAARAASPDREPTGATRALPRRQPPPQVPARRRVAAGAVAAGAGAGAAGAGRGAARPGGTARERAAAAPRRSGAAARRMLALLAIFLLIGAGTAVAIIATGNRDDAVHVKRVVSDNARDAIQQLQDIISDHTK